MDLQILKNMVSCFCNTILEINDASELEFDKTKNQFFEKYSQALKDKSLKFDLKTHQEVLHSHLNECCLEYIQLHLTKPEINFPFYHHENEKMQNYRNDFLLHLQIYTASKTVIDFFDLLFSWIDNIQKEHMADAIHISKKIDEKNSFNADAFTNRLEIQKTELEKQRIELEKLIQQIEDSKETLDKVQEKADSIDGKLLTAENKQNNKLHETEKNMIQTSVSILGIFAAVVLTFNMGISFAAEVLQTFMHSGVYHSVLVILLFGFIIGNVIFALFAFLRYIHKYNPEEKLHKTIIGKIVILFNVVLAVLMVINIICWDDGTIERRDKDIASKYSSEQTTVEETTTEKIEVVTKDAQE